jgi:hypothetical protein
MHDYKSEVKEQAEETKDVTLITSKSNDSRRS